MIVIIPKVQQTKNFKEVIMLNLSKLEEFIGSSVFYQHQSNLTYTEGVKYVADNGKAYWLIDAIASYQKDSRITEDPMLQGIQFWKLQVNEDQSAVLTCERDADDIAISQFIEFTNFPLKEIRFYLTNNVLMLPSEY